MKYLCDITSIIVEMLILKNGNELEKTYNNNIKMLNQAWAVCQFI